MKGHRETSRRRFLQMATAGAAGLPFVKLGEVIAENRAWTPKMAINPDIDNMKVVCCYDPGMLKSGAVMTNFASQNNAVNAEKVYSNLDEMARRLSGKTTSDDAWKTIFRSGKPWADTRVAIKVNCISTLMMPRIAIIAKLCKVLSGLGVQGKNIIIYDGSTNANGNDKYSSYCSLTDATKISAMVSNGNDALGGTTPVTIEGWTKSVTCTADIALGKIDILINCAVNKGHDWASNGYYTLCMKNHFGTFGPPSSFHGSTPAFININKHDALTGGNPVRQQLCIIDSLTGDKNHSGGNTPVVTHLPCRLIMGTFAPAVDYLCVTKVREPVMNATHDATLVNSLLPYFGYAGTDTVWQEYKPGDPGDPGTSAVKRSNEINPQNSLLTVHLTHSRLTSSPLSFSFDGSLRNPVVISISDISGKQIRIHRLNINAQQELSFQWDGKSGTGRDIIPGMYVIQVRCANWSDAQTMHVIK
jgi:hypothetical protein